MVYSISIHGSILRDTYDKYSDKDLLIVSDSYSVLNTLKNKYEKHGFSVSTYTYSKLYFLSKKGSLFIDHLVYESQIIHDTNNYLFHILSNHCSQIPSEKKLKEAYDYFDFLNIIPDCRIGYAWFCDCFYVGFRNLLILLSAKKLDYHFSYLTLLKQLRNDDKIDENDYYILKELRVTKKNYRDKEWGELPTRDFIAKVVRIANKLNLLHNIKFISEKDFIIKLKMRLKNSRLNYYEKLRLVEIYYLSAGKSVNEIDKIISNPQMYANKFKDDDYVNNIVTKIANKSTRLEKQETPYVYNPPLIDTTCPVM